MLNKVVLIGRLCADPDLRYTQSGIAVAKFNLAVDRTFKNQAGEREADFIPITVWRGAAESCAKYLTQDQSETPGFTPYEVNEDDLPF